MWVDVTQCNHAKVTVGCSTSLRASARCQELTQVLWDELFTVIHDEDPPDVQFDVVLLFLVLKEIKWSAAGNKEQGPELQLALHGEVLKKPKPKFSLVSLGATIPTLRR